jgi:hypothetical protein
MTLFIVLAILLPWSLYRQMHVHGISRESLVKLPLIFAGIGVIAQIGTHVDTSRAALAALALSVAASLVLGVWRGRQMPIWRGEDGAWLTQGNRLTMTLWGALIAFKFLLGAVASQTGWFPVETVGEIFITLGLSFAVQNIVVARRSIAQSGIVAAGQGLA